MEDEEEEEGLKVTTNSTSDNTETETTSESGADHQPRITLPQRKKKTQKVRIASPSHSPPETPPPADTSPPVLERKRSVRMKRTHAISNIHSPKDNDSASYQNPDGSAESPTRGATSTEKGSKAESGRPQPKTALPFAVPLDDGELTDMEALEEPEDRRPSESLMYEAEDESEGTVTTDEGETEEEDEGESNESHEQDNAFTVSIHDAHSAPAEDAAKHEEEMHHKMEDRCERIRKCARELEKRILQCEKKNHVSSERQAQKSGSCQKYTFEDEKCPFPFEISPDGELIVKKSMIVFANDHVAVLVTDPKRTKICVRQERLRLRDTVAADVAESTSDLALGEEERRNCGTSYGEKSCQTVSSGELGSCASLLVERLSCHKPEPVKRTRGLSSGGVGYPADLQYRLRRAIHPDTKVIIGCKEFPCHSVVLQMYSKYFDELKRPSDAIHRIRLEDEIITAEDFPSLMDWILLDESHKARVINRQNVVALYTAATSLVIPALKDQCDKFIKDKIESGDPIILRMYREARNRPKCHGLLKGLACKLAELFPVLFKTKQFLEIDAEDFVLVIDSDDLNIERELDVFHAASRWLLYDWKNRNRYAVRVMRCVRFGLMTPLQLTQIRHCAEAADMDGYHHIFSYQEIKDMVNDGLTYAIFKENYENRPKELYRWVDWSKVHAPRPRKRLRAFKQEQLCRVSSSIAPSVCTICTEEEPVKENCLPGDRASYHCSKPFPVESREYSTANPSMQSFSRSSINNSGRRRSSIRDPFTLASVLRFKNKLPYRKHEDGW